jgi:hypothetical protein
MNKTTKCGAKLRQTVATRGATCARSAGHGGCHYSAAAIEQQREANRAWGTVLENTERHRETSRQYRHVQRRRYKAALRAMKVASGCVDCGATPDDASELDFDHLPGFEKVNNVMDLASRTVPWAQIMAEVAKCEVVCKSCHRRRTRERAAEQRVAA